MGVVATVLGLVAAPWWMLLDRSPSSPADPTAATLLLVGLVAIGACLPPLADGVARLGRWRARIVGSDLAPHRPGSSSRAVYVSAGAVRAVTHLVTVALAGTAAGAVLVFLGLSAVVLVGAPLIVASGSGPIAFGPAQVGSIGGAALLTPVGLVLAIALPYALGAAALGEVALARVLLDRTPDRLGSALTEVVASRGRLADAFDAERRRIERDLHDGA
ncbi:MAG: sensor domain-containing protein, partial [Phycicoccus sp.]